jgi:hypothetical protein
MAPTQWSWGQRCGGLLYQYVIGELASAIFRESCLFLTSSTTVTDRRTFKAQQTPSTFTRVTSALAIDTQ